MMKLDFTRIDILKCLIISRAGISRKGILSLTGWCPNYVDKALSRLRKEGLILTERGFMNATYYPRAALIDNFTVTRDMLEYLELAEPGILPTRKKKRDNGIFEQCRSSPHQQRMMWFYGRHSFPGFKTLA